MRPGKRSTADANTVLIVFIESDPSPVMSCAGAWINSPGSMRKLTTLRFIIGEIVPLCQVLVPWLIFLHLDVKIQYPLAILGVYC